jgi:predicted DCC family thiol-disulfide oxidoreductase YuxK
MDSTLRPVQAAAPDQNATTPAATVYFDGACPLCSREIGAYRRLEGAADICWVDVHGATEAGPAVDLSREQALARFHVRAADGTLVSGGAAFVLLWRQLPSLNWLAVIASHPPVSWCVEPAYRLFLRLRPWLTRRRSTTSGAPV